jgi:recombination protein RecR
MSSVIEQLTESFRRFPGIGPRQAKRFVYYLLRSHNGDLEALARQILDLKKSVNQCLECRRFSPKESGQTLCRICRDPNRDHSLLMLVEKDIDLENVERSGTFGGYYFVLGGLIPVLDKNPEQSVHARELLDLIKKRLASGLQEIIVGVSANLEGDNTIEFIKNLLASSFQLSENELKISALGRGLSTGTELEYSDPDTLKNALKHRE